MIFRKMMISLKTRADKGYWEERYRSDRTGWDIGYASTPLRTYADQLACRDLKILIPGAGSGYEAIYLVKNGFTDVTVLDLVSAPLAKIKKELPEFPENKLLVQDFFEHQGQYDLILEQTFFCALPPQERPAYVKKMLDLLKPGGKLVGVLFNFPLTEQGPPFGGSLKEYRDLFAPHFKIKTLEPCYNSIKPRQGNELFFIFEKPEEAEH